MLINFDFDGVIADTFDQLLALCTEAQEIVAAERANFRPFLSGDGSSS